LENSKGHQTCRQNRAAQSCLPGSDDGTKDVHLHMLVVDNPLDWFVNWS